jgi:FKBP-type peptidyl-prolyl cis-trans isomerase SlyD
MDVIQPNAYAVVDYVLKDEDGQILDASDAEDGEPIQYVHGYGMLVPGLEAALGGMRVGESKEIVVPPEAGYGQHDDEAVLELDRSELPNPTEVKVGDAFVAETPDGDEVEMEVIKVEADHVVVDANHPLAGVTLRYSITVREVRAATDEEIADAATELEHAHAAHGTSCDDPTHDHSNLVPLRTKKPLLN